MTGNRVTTICRIYTSLAPMALLILPSLLVGCAIPLQTEEKEPRAIHHIIIGFGVVTVKQPNDISSLATSTQAAEISISDGPGPASNRQGNGR